MKIGLTGLLLASLVTVHELGHFLLAKLFKVKVLKFSLGFGPRLAGFKWGETEYRLSALPFGGYVELLGADPNEPLSAADRPRSVLEQAPWKRGLIYAAGPAMSLLFPILVYFAVFYFRTEDISSRLGRVFPDQPAYAAGLRPGDRIVAVDGQDVRYFWELRELIGPRWGRKVLVAFERGGKVQTLEVVPERTEEEGAIETEVRGVIGIAPYAPAPIVGIADPSSPAARAGLRPFDRIVKVDGQTIESYQQLADVLAQKRGQVRLTVVRDEPVSDATGPLTVWRPFEATLEAGEKDGAPYTGLESSELYVFSVRLGSPAAEAGLARGDRLLEVDGTALPGWATFEKLRREKKEEPLRLAWLHDGVRVEKTVAQRYVTVKDDFDKETKLLDFGAVRDERQTSFVPGERIPVDMSAWAALKKSCELVPEGIRTIGIIVMRLFTGGVSFKSVGGPLMMYDVAWRSAEQGWESYLEVMAIISINLGIMNLIPIPILDGFHILSAAWEGIRRRPLTVRARTIASYIGFALLVILMVMVMKNDITRLLAN